jgi:hypothetical protein
MSIERAGRSTKRSWITLGWIFSGLCFLLFGLATFHQFYLERDTILESRKALAEEKLSAADLVAPPVLDSKDGAFEAWKRDMAARSISTVAVKWAFLSIFAGTVAAGLSWLLVAGAVFGWWFLLDRIQDISQAARSKSN